MKSKINSKVYVTTNTNGVVAKKVPMFVRSGVRFDQSNQVEETYWEYKNKLKRSVRK